MYVCILLACCINNERDGKVGARIKKTVARTLSLSLSLYIYIYTYIYLSLSLSLSLYLSLPPSLFFRGLAILPPAGMLSLSTYAPRSTPSILHSTP